MDQLRLTLLIAGVVLITAAGLVESLADLMKWRRARR